jgi:adenylate cyclase class IV
VLEHELKSVVPDLVACRARVERAGARLTYVGSLVDRRWDRRGFELANRDHVLRTRVYHGPDGAVLRASLDWKGPTRLEGPYKVREELETGVSDVGTTALMLQRLGYHVSREIEREVAQYDLDGAMLRFERYPRMDDLVEVEGAPELIERAIVATGLPRAGFGTRRLADFAAAFERRTGQRAALCARELVGESCYRRKDA